MSDNKSFKLLKFDPILTPNKPGELIDININTICLKYDLNFTISKCFYITALNASESRGKHSNNNASEILICQSGSFTIKLHDGKKETVFELSKNDGIFIDHNVWVDFSNFNNCTILAFVNISPDVKHSCYDFDEFLLKHASK
jgi:mannose-6-phosphate isomerase-like protein (cupin superfamily)